MFCPRCGAPNRAQAIRCASCDAALTPQEPAGGVRAPGRPRRVATQAPRRPPPQAPSTQMGPPAAPPPAAPTAPAARPPAPAAPPARSPRPRPSTGVSSLSPWSADLSAPGMGNIYDQATLLDANALPEGPAHEPTPHPAIGAVGFRKEGDSTDMLQAETVMTPNGGAARRAWHDLAEAAAAPAQARFGGSAELDTPLSSLDMATDPELLSGSELGIDATRPIAPVLQPAGRARSLRADDPTELGARRVSVPPAKPAAPPVAARPPEPTRPQIGVPAYEAPASTRAGEPLRSRPPEAPRVQAADTAPLPPAGGQTRKLPTAVAAGRRPDTRTRSLSELDEPPNEPTRLGELAGPEQAAPNLATPAAAARPRPAPKAAVPSAEPPGERAAPRRAPEAPAPLASVPVYGAPRGPVAPAETLAAPGELAGLISDIVGPAAGLPQRPVVSDGAPLGVPVYDRLGVSASAARQGLSSHLPVAEPSAPPRVEPDPFATDDALDQERTGDYGERTDDFGVAPLEETRAFLDPLPDGQLSMPGEALSPVRPLAPLSRGDTGPMPAAALPGLSEAERLDGSPGAALASGPGAQRSLELAPRARRFFAALLDGGVVMGLLAVPALLEVFGADVARASPIDPDDLSRLLMQGNLTLPAVTGAALLLLYVTGTTAAGRSLGKLAFGLRVVDNDAGERPGVARALVRGAVAVLGGALLGIGPLWLLVDARGRALHDKLAGTTVVRVS
jgi:uncharacterized RDD family membrane protein YckC